MESRCFASLTFQLESATALLTSKGPCSHDNISNTVSVKVLRHIPYEAALKQFRLFFLTHRRIRGGSSLPMASWNSSWRPPSHIKSAKGYAATSTSSTNRDVVCAFANSPSPFGLSTHPRWNLSRHSWMPTVHCSKSSLKHLCNFCPHSLTNLTNKCGKWSNDFLVW